MPKLKSHLLPALITFASVILAACDSAEVTNNSSSNSGSNQAPEFSSILDAISIAENATGVIYIASATDADGDNISYSISGGDDSDKFSIATTSGSLQFLVAPDYENPDDNNQDRIYELELSASDGISSSTMALSITISDVDEDGANTAPTFPTSSESISISENSSGVIYTASASDADGDSITYSLSGGNDSDKFSIDSSSGELYFLSSPDYENPADSNFDNIYEIQIGASDGLVSASIVLLITVVNVNDSTSNQTPSFTSATAVSVNENTSGVIYTATADDADIGDTLTYSLIGGTDQSSFTLNGTELSFITTPDYENAADIGSDNTYQVQLRVTDTGGLFDELDLSISVVDINEAPTFTSVAAVNVSENTSGVIYTATAEDADAGDTLSYSIIGGADRSFFSLDGADLSFIEAPSYGSAADSNGDNIYEIQLRVTDANGLYENLNLSVGVGDVNQAPSFTSATSISVNENTSGVIYTATAEDADAGDTLSYSIIGGADRSSFTLDGADLSFITTPDYENAADIGSDHTYQVQLRVTDADGLTDELDLSISVVDINEAPAFTSVAAVNVSENTSGVIYTATAEDADAGDTLSYSIIGGADRSFFSLDGAELSFIEAPSYGSAADSNGDNIYELQLRVTDADGLYENLNLSVGVGDVNQAPSFTSATSISVNENTSGVIYTATADDADAGDTLSYSLIGGADQSSFTLNGADLSFTTTPDYENAADIGSDNTYQVQLRVTDADGLTDELDLSISVVDINEAPTFTSVAAVNVSENTSGVIYTATAEDADAGDTLSYSIIGGADRSFFSLDGADLSFIEAPSYGSAADSNGDNIYELQLRVTDANGLYENLNLSVGVGDVNQAPTFTSATSISVNENTSGVIYTATAEDADAGDTLSYRLIGGADQSSFTLNGADLSFTTPPDYENAADSNSDNTYQVQLRVTDTDGLTDELDLSISVVDINEAPTFTSATVVNVSENTSGVIYTATAEDADAGDTLSYSIIGGADKSFFSLDGADLSFIEAPSYGSAADSNGDNIYELQLRVADADGLYENLNLSVGVGDVNQAPTFTSATAVNVNENASGVIYTATAEDADAGDTLSYSLIGGTDQSSFTLDGTELSFSTNPDYENAADSNSDNTYQVQLRVTDADGLTDEIDLSISVVDINEAPTFTSAASISADENDDSVIYTATAEDADAGDTLSYSIIGGADRSFFSLDGADLSFIDAPSYASAADSNGDNIYELQLRVTDANGLYENLNLSVGIGDVNQAPSFTSATSISVNENTSGVIYTATAEDADAGDTLSYSLIGGTDQSSFTLDGADLSFITTPDYENAADIGSDNTYQVQLRVTDADGLTDELDLSISVVDINEAPTFTSATAVNVSENTSGVISTATAEDADAGDTLSYSLIGGTDQSSFTLNGANLSFTTTPDYENATDSNSDNTYQVQLRVTDADGLLDELDLSISVVDINEAPAFTSATSINVNENTSGVIYTATAEDADAGDTLSYSLIGGTDQSSFTLNGANLSFTTTPDYENATDSNSYNTYQVQLRVTDADGLLDELDLSISVVDINEAPTFTSATSINVNENTSGVIYTATADDADAGDTLSYSIIGGADQSSFTLNDADLSFTTTPDYENAADSNNDNTYQVQLRVTDAGGLFDELDLSVSIDDINEAPTASISVSPDPETTTITTSTEVTLNGSASSDPDGDSLEYTWSQPSGQSIGLSSTSSSSTKFTAATAGTYTFTLTVSDGELTDRAESIVTIDNNLPNDFAATTGDNQITLTWTPYSNSTIFNIYRSTDPDCDLDNYYTACSSSAGVLFNDIDTGLVDNNLVRGISYYYWIEAILDGVVQRATSFISATIPTNPINDTGIDWGGDYESDNNSDCSSNISAPQDCHQGRDATHNDDSDGHAGFSFTKLDSNGYALAASATNWSCVQDNVTGLIWEVKTDDGSERDKDNFYRWGGLSAIGRDSSNREFSYYDDWNDLVDTANSERLCSFNDWRVPDIEELRSIVDYSGTNPSIDTNYFPNTSSAWYWSASPITYFDDYAFRLYFGYGYESYSSRSNYYRVRLVRVSQ